MPATLKRECVRAVCIPACDLGPETARVNNSSVMVEPRLAPIVTGNAWRRLIRRPHAKGTSGDVLSEPDRTMAVPTQPIRVAMSSWSRRSPRNRLNPSPRAAESDQELNNIGSTATAARRFSAQAGPHRVSNSVVHRRSARNLGSA